MNLSEAIISSDSVLFVGSGVSTWSGLPTWGGMLNELADYLDRHGLDSGLVRAETQYGDLLQAASYGFDRLTRLQQGDFIRLSCRYGRATPSRLHEILVTMGPRCFVTTNYDNLIEEALRLWRPNDFFRPPITNRDLIGMPEIVQARAIDFIFKPHGDAADSDSIILTREQYRMLLPGGERQAALESLKLLLVSRPVIFVGFGLRDPDFLYLKDILLNIYKGGTRDHFALMADVSGEQIDYWRRAYGIHLIPYTTRLNNEGRRDHSALLATLESTSQSISRADLIGKARPASTSPETLLALARYASSLAQVNSVEAPFTIRVRSRQAFIENKKNNTGLFSGATIQKLLTQLEKPTILIGLPGAGKSYSLRINVAYQAESLHAACLQDRPDEANFIIPIFADLKLYEGNIENLITKSLPVGFNFRDILSRFKLRIYLDSFNETPRKFLESGECEADLQNFIKSIGSTPLIIGSRTLDGLERLGFEAYELASIEEATVTRELQSRGITLDGRFESEMTALLQRPFYFRYILSGEIELPKEPHPREFYGSLIGSAQKKLSDDLNHPIDLIKILRPVAYNSLNSGEEAFPLAMLVRIIEANFSSTSRDKLNASDIANRLVARSILTPYSGERIAFVHQSITEYLASLELAERFSTTPELLKEKLSLRRWDQTIFLTLSHLTPPLDQQFFKSLLDIDLNLAITATKFIEVDRDKIVNNFLNEIIQRREVINGNNFQTQHTMGRNLPVSHLHLPKLNEIIESNHPLKNSAIQCTIKIQGESAKHKYLQLIADNANEYNLCAHHIGPHLAPFAVVEDLPFVAHLTRQLELTLDDEFDVDEFSGFSSGIAEFVSELPFPSIRNSFFPKSELDFHRSPIATSILREVISEHQSTEALQCACDLLTLGDQQAVFSIYIILEYGQENHIDTGIITKQHIELILNTHKQGTEDEGIWAQDALQIICKLRPDLRSVVEDRAATLDGLGRVSLLICSQQDELEAFIELEKILTLSPDNLADLRASYISHWNLDWSEKNHLFIQLLQLKNNNLADALLGNGLPVMLLGIKEIEIPETNWWLEWIQQCRDEKNQWLASKLSSFIAKYSNKHTIDRLISDLNTPDFKHRSLLLSHVLPHADSVTTDDLSNETAIFALNNLLHGEKDIFHINFLGSTATESFVAERMLPLLLRSNDAELESLRKALNSAGQRHGRRYF